MPVTDIMNMHLHGDDDHSPMEMISRERLAYYQRLEAAVALLVETLAEKPEE